tara:strand:- start:2295 stop:2672 length:378 start_codon:yes stop_codon:yes gene_type:complete
MRKEDKMEITYKAVRVEAGVPIWSLFEVIVDGGTLPYETEIGSLTDFPNEGPVATVRFDGAESTVSAATVAECLAKAKDAIASLEANDAEGPIYDEDGQIALMRHLENYEPHAMDTAYEDSMGWT